MADLPSATAELVTTGAGGSGVDTDLVAIFSCTSSGTAATIARYRRVQDIADTFGNGEGIELAAHYVGDLQKSVLFCKMTSATAGSIGPVDVTNVTGTSVITFTGTPVDDEDLVIEVLTGGTRGTAGIEFRYSRDGGLEWSGTIRLGTAVTYTIPQTGVTVNFAAGTLVAGDFATCHCAAPRWDSTGLGLAFDALKAHTSVPRTVIICGDVIAASEVQACIDEIVAYRAVQKHSTVVCSARDRYPTAVMQGGPTVSTDQAAKKYTRGAGSFITDGFKEGMTATWAGFVNSASNGAKTISTLTATEMVVVEAIGANEAAVAATTVTGVESKATWRAAIEVFVGTSPAMLKTEPKARIAMGRARRAMKSTDGRTWRKARPFSWPYIIRCMGHDVHVSAAEVALGPLKSWAIFDDAEQLEQHNEYTDGGGLAMRMICATTIPGESGTFVAQDITLADDNARLSRTPLVHVGQVACMSAQASYTRKLNGRMKLDPATGYPLEGECRRVDSYALDKLKRALLADVKGEGARASDVTCAMARNVDLRTVGATVPVEVVVTGLGYTEKFTISVRVA